MKRHFGRVVVGGAVLLFLQTSGTAQFDAGIDTPFTRDRGQDVSPTFDGWMRNPDGTYTFYFGYLNRNRAEEIHIPVGPDNSVDGGPDRGQPTYFYPAAREAHHRWWVFRIVVPADWPEDRRLVWTLRSRGRTNQAKAWRQPEYEVGPVIMGRNAADGFLFNRPSVADLKNQPPVISGSPKQAVTLPASANIYTSAEDDGRPLDGRGKPEGVRVRWILYRGPTGVKYSQETSRSPKAETNVTFNMPGEYRLRAIASDGELASTHDIDVTVKSNPADADPR